jgi:phospholipid/cholesterol/gamma-HCH transport system substrate-binding protein
MDSQGRTRLTRSTLEIVVGGVVLAFLAMVFAFAYGGPTLTPVSGYTLRAGFSKVDGLGEGDDVRLSGIKVGSVERESLDNGFRAVLTLRIDEGVRIPADSSAAIHTDGLFGSKFVVLDPGGDTAMLKDGDEIQYTQDAVIVSDLLEMIISEGKARQGRSKAPGGEAKTPATGEGGAP